MPAHRVAEPRRSRNEVVDALCRQIGYEIVHAGSTCAGIHQHGADAAHGEETAKGKRHRSAVHGLTRQIDDRDPLVATLRQEMGQTGCDRFHRGPVYAPGIEQRLVHGMRGQHWRRHGRHGCQDA